MIDVLGSSGVDEEPVLLFRAPLRSEPAFEDVMGNGVNFEGCRGFDGVNDEEKMYHVLMEVGKRSVELQDHIVSRGEGTAHLNVHTGVLRSGGISYGLSTPAHFFNLLEPFLLVLTDFFHTLCPWGACGDVEGVGTEEMLLQGVVPRHVSIAHGEGVLPDEGGVAEPVGNGVVAGRALLDEGITLIEVQPPDDGDVGRGCGEERLEETFVGTVGLEEGARLVILLKREEDDVVRCEMGERGVAYGVDGEGVYPYGVVADVGEGSGHE